MQGKDADATVWITIRPCMGNGGIIDRQELEHTLTGLNHEVYHRLEVAKVAYTSTLLAAQ